MRLDTFALLLIHVVALGLLGQVRSDEVFSRTNDVLLLNSKSFDRKITANYTAAMVLFYVPYDDETSGFASTYSSIAQRYQGLVNMAAVDCSDLVSHEICRRYGIEDFPTIKLFPPSVGHSKKELDKPINYEGSLSAYGMGSALKDIVTDAKITVVSSKDGVSAKLKNAKSDKTVLLFSEKTETSFLHKAIAWKYHHLAEFYEVKKSATAVRDMFGVTQLPALIVSQGERIVSAYSGDQYIAGALVAYLDEVLGVPSSDNQIDTDLRILTEADFDRIDQDEEIWLVGFFADPEGAWNLPEVMANGKKLGTRCSESLEELDEAMKRAKEIARVGVFEISSTQHTDILSLIGVEESVLINNPCDITVVRFPFGKNKSGQHDFKIYFDRLDAKMLQDFALAANPIEPFEITEDSAANFLGALDQATTHPRPKVLLFSSFESCPPIFSALAMSLRHWKADFGFIPSSQQTLREEFQITEVPTLTMIYFDPKAEEGKQLLAPRYPGVIKYRSMKEWIQALFIVLKIDKKEYNDPFFELESDDVPRITSQEDLAKTCNESVAICGIFVLDENHEKFSHHLESVQRIVLAQTARPGPFTFTRVHSDDAPNLIKQFGVGPGDVPSLIVYNQNKKRYTLLKREVDPRAVDKFLEDVLSGKEKTFEIEETLELRAQSFDQQTGSRDEAETEQLTTKDEL